MTLLDTDLDLFAEPARPKISLNADTPLELTGRFIHFVGIGGCGMSGLAQLVRHAGAICSGSDMAPSQTVQRLRSQGIAIATRQTAASVPDPCDLLVISAAIRADHPEVIAATDRGIPVMKYAQLLGRLMIGRTGVAVAGTHGKSSTTSMLSHVLIQAGLDPSFIVGATCEQIGGGSRTGQSPLLVAEACEYDRSFHNFHPTHAVILNVEADHLDLYKSIDEVVESFAVFARRVPRDGTLLLNHEMPHRLAITAGLDCEVETIGFAPQADWRVYANGGPKVRLTRDGEPVCEWTSPMPGEHMAYNAAVAAVTAHRLGATWEQIAEALASFRGLDRRMQVLGTRAAGPRSRDAITIIDDYGHHPTEVDTTLRALRRHYKPKRLICVFQPHQHSRTRFLMEQFAASFAEADIVIVPDIYFSRDSEAERRAVTAADLVDRLRNQGVTAMHLYPFGAIVEQLQVITRGGDLVVTMGAGDVWKVAHAFLAAG
jgi:UDP-N-acetylmuramate--alanine ligase